MNHAYITGVGLLLILVDSFSGWSEVICALVKKGSTIYKTDSKRHIFQKRHIKNPGMYQMYQNFVMKIFVYGGKNKV